VLLDIGPDLRRGVADRGVTLTATDHLARNPLRVSSRIA
jgi:hypothetical protein